MSVEPPKGQGRVGYGHPPMQHRFQPGRSGNPGGRPKGSRNLTALLEAELGRSVTVTEQGKRRRVSKAVVIARQLANKAAGGDLKAVEMLLRHLGTGRGGVSGQTADALAAPAEADRDILNHLLDRMEAARREEKEAGDA